MNTLLLLLVLAVIVFVTWLCRLKQCPRCRRNIDPTTDRCDFCERDENKP
jgi:hypothetical protein